MDGVLSPNGGEPGGGNLRELPQFNGAAESPRGSVLAGIEIEPAGGIHLYFTLICRFLKLFQAEMFSRQQILHSIISDGQKMLEQGQVDDR